MCKAEKSREEVGSDALLNGYRQMAADLESEREAQEWCEGLVSDAFEATESGARL
jgi:hypothetical protein